MRSHRVVVTGMGCVSPYGVGVSALWKGIREGRSALRRSPHLDVIVGAVPSASDECDAAFDVEARFSVREQREKTRAALLALTAADEALADARLVDVEATFHDETGVNFGEFLNRLIYKCHISCELQEQAFVILNKFNTPANSSPPAIHVASAHFLCREF